LQQIQVPTDPATDLAKGKLVIKKNGLKYRVERNRASRS